MLSINEVIVKKRIYIYFFCDVQTLHWAANHMRHPEVTPKSKWSPLLIGDQRKGALFRTDKNAANNRSRSSSPFIAEITVKVNIRSRVRYPKIQFLVIPHFSFIVQLSVSDSKLKTVKEIKESSSPVILPWDPLSSNHSRRQGALEHSYITYFNVSLSLSLSLS